MFLVANLDKFVPRYVVVHLSYSPLIGNYVSKRRNMLNVIAEWILLFHSQNTTENVFRSLIIQFDNIS